MCTKYECAGLCVVIEDDRDDRYYGYIYILARERERDLKMIIMNDTFSDNAF